MREFQAKKKVKRVLYSRFVVIVLAILVVVMARATWSVYEKQKGSAANVARAEAELKRMQEREALLNSEIERLTTQQGIEEEIRSKYSVAKEGEHMLIIVDSETASTTPAEKESWWEKFKKIFK